MTLQEIKDQVAKKHRYKDWEDLVLQFQAKNHVDEVAELYARSKWDEACEAMREDMQANYIEDGGLVLHRPKPEFKI